MLSEYRLKNIELIVSDVDGTLLDDNGAVGSETKKLVRRLTDSGVIFGLATGRLHSATVEVAHQLSIKGPIISLDGALIKNYPGGEIIYQSFIKEKQVKKALKFANDLLLNVVLCHADAIYYTDNNNVIPSLLSKYGAIYKPVESYADYINDTLEIVFASDMKDSLKFVNDKLSFPSSVGCSTTFFKSHTYENLFYLEIRKSESSKGRSLKRLLKYLKIKPYNVAVMGDWYNDISLFDTKGLKVAVANAIPELRTMADFVTKKTNREEGVVEFFEKVLKAKQDN